jgi:hypothetical protein
MTFSKVLDRLIAKDISTTITLPGGLQPYAGIYRRDIKLDIFISWSRRYTRRAKPSIGLVNQVKRQMDLF